VLKLNSFVPEIQNRMAGHPAAHATIQTALANLTAVGYPSAAACLGISSVICQPNRDEIVTLWTWARDHGIEPYLERMNPWNVRQRTLTAALPPPSWKPSLLCWRASIANGTARVTPQPPLAGTAVCAINFPVWLTALAT